MIVAGFDIDEQAMNEAILNPHASQRRRSRAEEPGVDSDYAPIVAELRQLRAAAQLSRLPWNELTRLGSPVLRRDGSHEDATGEQDTGEGQPSPCALPSGSTVG